MYIARPPRPRMAMIDDPEVGLAMTADQVIDGEDSYPTGIFAASGNMIWRCRDPIGFRLSRRET